MAPKRKWVDEPDVLPAPSVVRRSGRQSAKQAPSKADEPVATRTDVDATNITETPRSERKGDSKKHDVERAKQHLCEMEQRLQDAVKQQRMAVLNSKLRSEDSSSLKTGQELSALYDNPPGMIISDDPSERGAARPPPVNSEKLPLPWSGRLGYACLNTYLRSANQPVFSSRTCRISSILEHRHPLRDESQPEHPTKNRPNRDKPPSVERGLRYVQELGLANARDIPTMVRWNAKYGIRFMRLSSEMFPFASHEEYGYKLAPFASQALAEAGKVAAELDHRLTTHPGQYTQIGSPRQEVVRAAVRDLEYHDEMLSLLKLPPQMDRDAVMILHMGGTYGDKGATLDRFRANYAKLSNSVKNRLVLENDDVSWSVHDLLPICEELNIPLVLDFHHHNIIFDPSVREGTQDIIALFDRIRHTWSKKNIRQKMHYSEQTASAVTPRERRKHSARVKTLPPCATDMDLMIEAKDKEQAVFDLMRNFKLPGWQLFNDIIPHERDDEPEKHAKKGKRGAKKSPVNEENITDDSTVQLDSTPFPEDVGMGGPHGRVYWPEGMEDWLRPKKREPKKATVKTETEE